MIYDLARSDVPNAARPSVADSQSQSDTGLIDSQLIEADFVQAFRTQVVDDLLTLNFGEQARGAVWPGPNAIADDSNTTQAQALIRQGLSNPQGFQALAAKIDWDTLLATANIPTDANQRGSISDKLAPQNPEPPPAQEPESPRIELAGFNLDEPRDANGQWTNVGGGTTRPATTRASTQSSTTHSTRTTQPATRPAIPDEYVVHPGDTLSGIARKLTGNAQNSKLLTNIPSGDPNKIYPGDIIPLPEAFKQKMRDFQGQTSTTQPATTPSNGTTQPATQPAIPDTYTVVPHDTLSEAARKLTGSAQNWHLLPIIHPGDPDRLDIGDQIPLPEAFKEKMREFQAQTPTTQPSSQPASKPSLQPAPAPANAQARNLATPENINELARVLMSEASGQKEAWQIAVGNTVLNRMRRNGNTDKVKDVTGNGKYADQRAPSPQMIDLAKRLLNGEIADNTGGATHFFSPGATPKDAHSERTVPNWANTFEKKNVPGGTDNKFRFYKQPGDGPVQ